MLIFSYCARILLWLNRSGKIITMFDVYYGLVTR